MTRLEQRRTYQKRSDPTQEGTREKANQARTCQEGTGEKRPEQYITKGTKPEQTSQNRPNQTEENSLDQSRPKQNDEPNECEQERVDLT